MSPESPTVVTPSGEVNLINVAACAVPVRRVATRAAVQVFMVVFVSVPVWVALVLHFTYAYLVSPKGMSITNMHIME
jgi:hypothetical protein